MQNKSLASKIWEYLIIFSVAILMSLWLFQVIFLKSYYRTIKKKNIISIANSISENYNSETIDDLIDKMTFNNNVCIEVINKSNMFYSSNNQSKSCIINKDINDKLYIDKKISFINSNNNDFEFETTNPRFKNQTLIYGKKLNDDIIIFVTTSLEPLDSTTNILASQLVYVTIGVLLLSFLVSYYISKRISKPIVKINESAKMMSNGNYNIKCETDSNIKEINELTNTLNETALELSKTENLRRELLANVSHDLKTPLTMIKAYAEMARDLNQKNTIKRNENLNIIIEETDRLNLLVNDILELSKEQSNVNKLNIEQFNLIDLIKSIIKRYEYLEATEKYNFIFEYETNNIVKADKKRIEQVIYNLINNAINYTGDDKKIIIKVENTNKGTKVSIIDTGNGIDKDDLNLIWDKYYKVDKSYKRVTVGTGLGLSIVKNILINHNFDYGVNSAKGNGTTFWFIIK